MPFSPNVARQLPELYRPSVEHPKTGWVSRALSTVRLKVAGLVAQNGDKDVLYRFHIRGDIVLLEFYISGANLRYM